MRAARGPHSLAPRQAQRWRLPRWAELVSWGRRSSLPRAPGGRCAAPPRCAPRLAPRPRGGPSRPSPARRPARPPKVRTRRPVTRAHSLPAPREPDLHLFVFFPARLFRTSFHEGRASPFTPGSDHPLTLLPQAIASSMSPRSSCPRSSSASVSYTHLTLPTILRV